MKIALRGPIAWRTRPCHCGPWEQITGLLADGLAQRGIDVPLFATLDSITLARLEGIRARPPYDEDDQIDGRVWEALHVAHALSRSAGFDLIDNHLDWLPLAFSGLAQAPMVTTIHGSPSPRILRAYLRSNGVLLSISDAERAPELDYAAPGARSGRGRGAGLPPAIAFVEPFALSVVQSMLCGTPAVAHAHGSMAEVILDGVTGVLADSVESAVAGCEARGTARPGRVSPGCGAAVVRRPSGRLLPRCLRKGPL